MSNKDRLNALLKAISAIVPELERCRIVESGDEYLLVDSNGKVYVDSFEAMTDILALALIKRKVYLPV